MGAGFLLQGALEAMVDDRRELLRARPVRIGSVSSRAGKTGIPDLDRHNQLHIDNSLANRSTDALDGVQTKFRETSVGEVARC